MTKMNQPKITFILPRLVFGGVERVTLNLIKNLQENGIKCHLIVLSDQGNLKEEAYATTSVKKIENNNIFQIIKSLKKEINKSKPTHVITAFTDLGLLTSLVIDSKIIHIHTIHNTHDSIVYPKSRNGIKRKTIDYICASLLYKRTNHLVCVSNGLLNEVKEKFNVSKTQIKCIYNPVISNKNIQIRNNCIDFKMIRFISIGRLTYQKGYDNLIDIMHRFKEYKNWQLEIWGDGEEYINLTKKINKLGLDRHIFLKGATADPLSIMNRSDIFLLPSRFEGLPTVLIEALSCGLLSIAYNCKHGPYEILEDGKYGILIDNQNPLDFEKKIYDIIVTKKTIKIKPFTEKSKQFNIENSIRKWLDLINETKNS